MENKFESELEVTSVNEEHDSAKMKDSNRTKELLAQARGLIYEAISLESGDTVEEVKEFFESVEKRAENRDEQTTGRQHVLFSNMVSNDEVVGVCVIIGYQKKNVNPEIVVPIKRLTARLVEPLGQNVLVTAIMSIESKKINVPVAVEVESKEQLDEARAEIVSVEGEDMQFPTMEATIEIEAPAEIIEVEHEEVVEIGEPIFDEDDEDEIPF